jgi:esterase FrsA
MKTTLMIILASAVLTAATLSSPGHAQDASGFRTVSEGDWYHPIEINEWIEQGGDRAVIEETLMAIQNATGERLNPDQPDTLLAFGPGHWTYEWTQRGDTALASGRNAETTAKAKKAFEQAILYYTMASSPHTHDPNNLAALAKASEAYLLAASLIPERISQVSIAHDGNTFLANFHVPQGEGPFPFVIASQGSDQSKEMLFTYFEEYLAPRGIGLLSLDMPGMGGSAAYDLKDGETDKLHIAALQWARTQPEVDQEYLFLQGSSFGGHAAARAFLKSDDLNLAGVIYTCGILEEAFTAPIELYEALPAFTTDGVKARLKLPIGGGFEEFAELMRPLALTQTGLLDGRQRTTPLLFIGTSGDPVSSLDEIDVFLNHAANATRIIIDEDGHCPETDVEDILMASWIVDQLPRVDDDDDDD